MNATTTVKEDLARARREYIEAVIVEFLDDNFYRIARYPDAEMARPAIENLARELRQRLESGVLP